MKYSENNKNFSTEREEIDDTTIHTYNTYNTYTTTIQKLLRDAQLKERKVHVNLSFSPTVWKKFREWQRRTDPFGSSSATIEQFMVGYILHAAENRHQPKITQFFFNKPRQVNIAKKQVIVSKKLPKRHQDYSNLSLEELQKEYDHAKKLRKITQVQLLAFELKKRGIYAR